MDDQTGEANVVLPIDQISLTFLKVTSSWVQRPQTGASKGHFEASMALLSKVPTWKVSNNWKMKSIRSHCDITRVWHLTTPVYRFKPVYTGLPIYTGLHRFTDSHQIHFLCSINPCSSILDSIYFQNGLGLSLIHPLNTFPSPAKRSASSHPRGVHAAPAFARSRSDSSGSPEWQTPVVWGSRVIWAHASAFFGCLIYFFHSWYIFIYILVYIIYTYIYTVYIVETVIGKRFWGSLWGIAMRRE